MVKKLFSTNAIVGLALFSALSYVVSFLEFPIFPATPFLKLDFSCVFTLLASFMYGPIGGAIVCAVKELLCFLTKSSTGGVGELANFVISCGFILIPSIVYFYRKGFKIVVITLLCACVVQVGLSLLMNRYVNFPFFMGAKAEEIFNSVWHFVLLFNLIKSVAICVITILLYKRVSWLIRKI
jgi:riboflavin transporter FmnP